MLIGILHKIVIVFLLRLIDGLLYVPSCLLWLLMGCPRDPQQVH
jgi:membrane protein required for beta-lactamase induction